MDETNLTKKERRELRRQEKLRQREKATRKRRSKRIALWFFVILGLVLIGFAAVKLIEIPAGQIDTLTGDISDSDQVKGNKEAQTVLVEYSDFQCPACALYYSMVKQLINELGDEIAFVYRHFPLSQHQNAELAARAAEAAGLQGKFWEMHDRLFENQKAWSEARNAEELFAGYAASLGLDLEKFRLDLDSREVRNKVENDRSSGIRAQVNYTPTFYLNGQKIQNPRSYEELRTIINASLQTSD